MYSVLPTLLTSRNTIQNGKYLFSSLSSFPFLLTKIIIVPDLPHMILDDEPTPGETMEDESTLPWLYKYYDLAITESIGKGAIGDYYRGSIKGKDVSITYLNFYYNYFAHLFCYRWQSKC